MAAMKSWIDYSGEVVWDPDPSLIARLVEAGQPFWLDIENPADELIFAPRAKPALDALRQAGSVQPQLGGDPIRALHPLISSLYTQFSALVLRLDERLDALERFHRDRAAMRRPAGPARVARG
jgi:hypothetical protein